jgi:hypothetical protein
MKSKKKNSRILPIETLQDTLTHMEKGETARIRDLSQRFGGAKR